MSQMVGHADLEPTRHWTKHVDVEPTSHWTKHADLEPTSYWIKQRGRLVVGCDATPSEPLSSLVEDQNADESYDGRLATPLVQVLSVRISTVFDDGKPCEIYGKIQALEGPDPLFLLYDRDPEDSENIRNDGTLSLITPIDGVIVPSVSTSLDLCLKDRIRGVEIVNEKLFLNPVTEDSYDRLLVREVKGAYGFAKVYYVVFQFAVNGIVEVTVTKYDKVNKNGNAADIYGTVVAEYENGWRHCVDDQEVKLLETRLIDKPSYQPLRAMVGTPIGLSRHMVAVPTYSSLNITLNLWDSYGKIAGNCIQFPAHFCAENPVHILTKHACVRVRVQWHHAYHHLHRKVQDSTKNPRSLHDQQIAVSRIPRHLIDLYFGKLKAEVFTVFVGGITEKISALCGTIMIDDGTTTNNICIYKRDEDCPELLPDNGLASIEFNYRAIHNCEFGIILNLRDPVGKLKVSKGSVVWNVGLLKGSLMCDKQLCSVVHGKDGYAAVHYEIFDNAFEALLEVKLFADVDHDIPINLYGTLVATYSGHDYSTINQKKYYRSRLLDHPRDRSVELTDLKSGSGIALLKSIVAVPARRSLIIEANLGVFGTDNVDEAIAGTTTYEIDLGGTISKRIRGERYWIEVYAKFKS